MILDEFTPIAAQMQARWWSFPIPPSALDQYLHDLGDLPASLVARAVEVLGVDGVDGRPLDRPPTTGQIRRKVAEMEMDAPSWDDVRTALVQWRAGRPARLERVAAWACPDGQCEGDGWIADKVANEARECSCRPRYIAAKNGHDQLPALVAEFIREKHVDPHELDQFLDRGDGDTEARVRNRWREFSGRAVQSRVLAGLPETAALPRLEAARAEDAGRFGREVREGDLRKMSAVALLEQGGA